MDAYTGQQPLCADCRWWYATDFGDYLSPTTGRCERWRNLKGAGFSCEEFVRRAEKRHNRRARVDDSTIRESAT